jgi:predicted nucleic acid-binding protein
VPGSNTPPEVLRTVLRTDATVIAAGRKARGARAADLLIAAVACSVGLPLFTRNPDDFRALEGIVTVIEA